MNLKVIVHEAEEGGFWAGRDPKRSEFGCSSCWWKKGGGWQDYCKLHCPQYFKNKKLDDVITEGSTE